MTNVSHLNLRMAWDSLDEAFPDLDCGHRPLGTRLIVQIRTPKNKTASGIILTRDTQETEAWNTQVGKVISLGPLAFHDRKTNTPWPEGAWVKVGDYVRVPKHGGDSWHVAIPDRPEEFARFVLFNDLDLLAVVSDPLTVRAFV